jgi:hypothetical protein
VIPSGVKTFDYIVPKFPRLHSDGEEVTNGFEAASPILVFIASNEIVPNSSYIGSDSVWLCDLAVLNSGS